MNENVPKGARVWAVTWSGEDGTDVHLFRFQGDAERTYDELCKASDVNPELGYAAEGHGYTERPDSNDDWASFARFGSEQVNIEMRRVEVQ